MIKVTLTMREITLITYALRWSAFKDESEDMQKRRKELVHKFMAIIENQVVKGGNKND